MARIQITLPEKFQYHTEITIRISDLNYGGHVGHDTMITLLQEARVNYYTSLGYKNEISFEGTVGQIIADVAVQYKAESFFGDVLSVEIGVLDITKVAFDLVYQVTNKTSRKTIAIAKTGIVCFDYAAHKVAPIPEKLLKQLLS